MAARGDRDAGLAQPAGKLGANGTGDTAESSDPVPALEPAPVSVTPSAAISQQSFGVPSSASLVLRATREFDGDSAARNNYVQDVRYSPDGLCLLATSNDSTLRLYETPEAHPNAPQQASPAPAVTVRESGSVYDSAWYPRMNSGAPRTCVFAAASRHSPTHLWDAFTGRLRASYCAMDDNDVPLPTLSLAFTPEGAQLICGHDGAIRIFDVERPGRDCDLRPLAGRKQSRKRKRVGGGVGQRGLVSALDTAQQYGGLIACGSYAGSTYVYEKTSGSVVCSLDAHQAGVTHVRFSPDATRLWTGGRRDNFLLEWDLRMLRVLARYERTCDTNQRYRFDISPVDGRFLATGARDGRIRIFDTLAPAAQDTKAAEPSKSDVLLTRTPDLSFSVPGGDAVGGVSFHPRMSRERPMLACCTGERKFWLDAFDDSDSSDSITKSEPSNSVALFRLSFSSAPG